VTTSDHVPAQTQNDTAPTIAGRPAAWLGLVRFGEVALKKGNRSWFMKHLRDNIAQTLRGLPVADVHVRPGRCVFRVKDASAWPEVRERLSRTPGVTSFSLALEVPADLEAIKETYDVLVHEPFESFRVRANRVDKSFRMRSNEIERELGAWIQQHTGARVDLTRGELTFGVEVRREGALVFVEQTEGPGGLPAGTSGRVAVLLSGGIDSPIAAYRMMKRGCRAVLIHFTSFPFTDASSWDKCRALARMLTRYQLETRMFVVPLGEVQQRIVVAVPPRYRILLYRRMMLRIAEELARRANCQALVTGESVGQVGSQTLANLTSIERVATMPVLRPLIGFDKLEIVNEARKVGTYETSIEPDMDCCQYLMPPKVATTSTPRELDEIESELDIPELVEMALAGVKEERFQWPEA
jgi:tRNA uracil 4-sulfurtransferase